MDPSRLPESLDKGPPSYDRHLADSPPPPPSSADRQNPWRPHAAFPDLGRPGPYQSSSLQRIASDPAEDKPAPSIGPDAPLHPGLPGLPPEYTRQDPNDQVFRLQPPFISSAPTEASTVTPRFQLAQLRTSTNKPYKLRLRRLTTNECRRLAVAGEAKTLVEFDDDLVLYLIANTHALFPWSPPEIEIRGCKARTLQGLVELKKTATAHQFWHVTKNEANDMLRPENQRKLEKYGYHAEDEIRRELLFSGESVALLSRDTKWKDGAGICVATESEGALRLTVDLSAERKDALLACWAAKCWIQGSIGW